MSEPDPVPGPEWCSVRFEPAGGPGDVPAIVVQERVRLSDTDSSGLIYYGAVTTWLTRAQAELYLALGLHPRGLGPWPITPVVNANISYHAQLGLADPYELRTWVDEAGTTSLTIAFEVTRAGTRCVSARMTHVNLDPDTHRPAPLPPELAAAASTTRHR